MAQIIIITDDLETRVQTVSALDGAHDIRSTPAPRSRSAWRRLTASEPDIIIMDAPVLFMPETRRLRAGGGVQDEGGTLVRTQAPAVLVVLETGQEERIIPCFEAGADDYLLRPIDGPTARGKVDGLLAMRLGLLDAITNPIAISDDGRILRPNLDEDPVHAQLGRYEIRGELGRGGYGVVYRAHDMAMGRDVALKLLPKELHDNAEAVARFFREATAVSRLNHPNIVKFYEVGSYKGRFYFTMELVEGRTLKRIADRESPLPVWRAARYLDGMARALAAIDSLGLVHRDIKPENVLITADDTVKLIDFGLVRIRDTAGITSQDDVLGTPYFMCPEYIKAPGVPDIRYDLYALGVTFFHLLTGEYPFDGKNPAHVMEKHLRCPAPSIRSYEPSLPLHAERIVSRLLRKDPDMRPQTPEEVLVMLKPLML